jgi:hypothetical protein
MLHLGVVALAYTLSLPLRGPVVINDVSNISVISFIGGCFSGIALMIYSGILLILEYLKK